MFFDRFLVVLGACGLCCLLLPWLLVLLWLVSRAFSSTIKVCCCSVPLVVFGGFELLLYIVVVQHCLVML